MKTSPVSANDLCGSVLALPPLPAIEICLSTAKRTARWLTIWDPVV